MASAAALELDAASAARELVASMKRNAKVAALQQSTENLAGGTLKSNLLASLAERQNELESEFQRCIALHADAGVCAGAV